MIRKWEIKWRTTEMCWGGDGAASYKLAWLANTKLTVKLPFWILFAFLAFFRCRSVAVTRNWRRFIALISTHAASCKCFYISCVCWGQRKSLVCKFAPDRKQIHSRQTDWLKNEEAWFNLKGGGETRQALTVEVATTLNTSDLVQKKVPGPTLMINLKSNHLKIDKYEGNTHKKII